MSLDAYPASLSFEIDRPKLKRYLRLRALGYVPALMITGLLIGFTRALNSCKEMASVRTPEEVLYAAVCGSISGALIGAIIAFGLYWFFFRRLADKKADTLEISVEGPFLHLFQIVFSMTDRKLHFRSIVDYSVVQTPFMRLMRVHGLQLNILAGLPITIVGIKDCLKVRDILSEIDAAREHRSA